MKPSRTAYGVPAAVHPGPSWQARRIGLVALLLLAGWRLLLVAILPAEFAGSPYQQNLLRIERLQRRVEAGAGLSNVLVGTSIAGRFLPEYFSGTSLAGLANLGLDGTTPAFALEALLD